jgi:hypothetical protein
MIDNILNDRQHYIFMIDNILNDRILNDALISIDRWHVFYSTALDHKPKKKSLNKFKIFQDERALKF